MIVAQVDRAAAFADYARRYSELGWALIRADGKEAKGLAWEKTQPKEPGAAAGEWSVWGKALNMGIVCGTSGLAVIDVDIDDDPEGALLALLGTDVLPHTPISRTGGGRLQVFYADPGGIRKRARDGIELRVGAHQCIVAPSVHPDTGRSYRWLIGHEPWKVPVAQLPQKVIDHFGAEGTRDRPEPRTGPISPGNRHDHLLRVGGALCRQGVDLSTLEAALLAENEARCVPPKDRADVVALAADLHGRYPATPAVHTGTGTRVPIQARERSPLAEATPQLWNGKPEPSRLELRNLAEYTVRQVVWYDKPFWQASAFHLLAGRKGSCKGTYSALLAARVTTGDLCGIPKRVLVVTSEDSVELDFLPRLAAAGGDPSLVEIVVGPFRLPHDIGWIKEQALKLGDVGLIIIDPLGNHVGDGDTYKPGVVRDAIGPLNPLADELDCIVLGVHHLGKDTSRGALASVLGSTAFVDVPRAVILMAADDQDERLYHAQVVAGNRGPRGSAGRQFRLELVDIAPATDITKVVPAGASTKDIEDLLAPKGADGNAKSTSASAAARELILDILENEGPQESRSLDERVATETGLATKTIVNLRSKLNKDEGLIKPVPDKDEYGTVLQWHVHRTTKPREPLPDSDWWGDAKPHNHATSAPTSLYTLSKGSGSLGPDHSVQGPGRDLGRGATAQDAEDGLPW